MHTTQYHKNDVTCCCFIFVWNFPHLGHAVVEFINCYLFSGLKSFILQPIGYCSGHPVGFKNRAGSVSRPDVIHGGNTSL